MTAPKSVPLHALAEDNLASASPDLLRAMVKTFADALMSAEADTLCNAGYGQVSDERVNHRNGYRPREWDTRAGTVELAVPKLRQGSCFPHWLLERRRRAEQALISVVATAYLLGVSTRRVEKLAESLGVTQLSKSQVSAMAKHLDEQVAAFRNRSWTPAWLQAGVRVAAALTKMAAYSEFITLPLWQLVPLPDGLDPQVASAVPLDHLTALSLLDTHGRLRTGDTVLIQGASGGVGQAVGTLGRLRGLRMYGTASSPGSREALARHGVTFIDYRREDFEAVLRECEPGGVQAVFDHIGGNSLRKGYRILAPDGMLVSYAFSGRPGHMVGNTVRGAARVKFMNLRPHRRTALSMVPHEIKADHDGYRTALAKLLDMANRGVIAPQIAATFPLQKAAHVHAALERREITGKVVLTME